jgi:hypothetical protein
MTTTDTQHTTWLLSTYRIDGQMRELNAIRAPGEQTLPLIDVLTRPRSQDCDVDQRHR